MIIDFDWSNVIWIDAVDVNDDVLFSSEGENVDDASSDGSGGADGNGFGNDDDDVNDIDVDVRLSFCTIELLIMIFWSSDWL